MLRMVSFLSFPTEIIAEFYSYLNFAEKIRLSGVCSYLRTVGKGILPRDESFEKLKLELILEKATSPLIWDAQNWMIITNFAKLYEKFFFSFNRTGMKFKEFIISNPGHFEIFADRVWNVALFGKPQDK
jgi:hypothetical protein